MLQLTQNIACPCKAINGIAVHTTRPYVFATASDDFTVRVYDLRYPATDEARSTLHAGAEAQRLGNAAHAMPHVYCMVEGVGRCVYLLHGNGEGGHRGPVLNVVRKVLTQDVACTDLSQAWQPGGDCLASCGVSVFVAHPSLRV